MLERSNLAGRAELMARDSSKHQGFLPPALRHHDFRMFWVGQAFSVIANQFTSVAMAWQIYELTNSPLQIGLLGLARALPQMALTLVGGLLADAVDRRRMLMATQVAQFVVAAILVLFTVSGVITPAVLYACSAFFALFTALENPSRQAYVPNLLPREQLASGIALATSQRQAGYIIGPSLGGVLLAFAGPGACYAGDAISRFFMFCTLLVIHGRQPSRRRGRITLSALGEGITFVRGERVVMSLMVLDLAANFFGSPRALLPVYARDVFHVGEVGLGMLFAASAIGAFSGSLVMGFLPQPKNAGIWVLVGVAFYSICAMGFAGTPLLLTGPLAETNVAFVAAVVLLGLMGVGDTVSSVLRGTINQAVTPDDLRGRVSAVNSVFINSGPALGQFESGVVADRWGVGVSAFTGGLATLLCVAGIALVPAVRRFRFPSTAPESVPARTTVS
jgi:MFS family permease